MLTLSLFRHAKSSWADPALDDFDRPLGQRGLDAAPAMAAFMAREGIRPDLVLCSPARRTRDTLALVEGSIGNPPATFPDKLYLPSAETLMALIQAVEDSVGHLMVVGHNPGLHALAVTLMRPHAGVPAKALTAKLPTAGLAVLTFPAKSWRAIAASSGQLSLFMTPKRLH